jgi:hypothetical protein
MATVGDNTNRSGPRRSSKEGVRVASLLEKLHLTNEEGEVATFCDDEEDA